MICENGDESVGLKDALTQRIIYPVPCDVGRNGKRRRSFVLDLQEHLEEQEPRCKRRKMTYLDGVILTKSQRTAILTVCNEKNAVSIESLKDNITEKLREGTYGDVYTKVEYGETSVVKILPFGGDAQLTFDSILSEVRITGCVSNWADRQNNPHVLEANRIMLAYRSFPDKMQNLWEDFRAAHPRADGNLNPGTFGPSQLYVVMEFDHGGIPIESSKFTNQQEIWSIFKQVSLKSFTSSIH